ncbi:DUF2471 family protein [Paraburkholderia bannensis]|nr:DUF2471 family protein [Paraburkholderia bannensis]
MSMLAGAHPARHDQPAAPRHCIRAPLPRSATAMPGVLARHPDAMRRGFARLADSRFAGSDIDAQVDWQCDGDPLPAG